MGVRINKYLADAGIASRREADRLVETGVVSINGMIAQNAMRVEEGDLVCVRGKKVTPVEEKHVVAYYKPVGVTCTKKDKHATLTIEDAIQYPVKLNYAGRLDRESEGLLILTNDGDLIERMMRGAYGHEKEYIVRTDKKITDDFMTKLQQGVWLPELEVKTRPCITQQIGEYTFRIILTQGLNRQIRRMCKEFGYRVRMLKRIRVMNVELGKMNPGELRRITGEELVHLYEIAEKKER